MLLLVLAALPHSAARAQEAPTADEAAEQQAGADADIEALIRILEDDEARARLIERLEAAGAAEPLETASERTLSARLAQYTRGVAEGAAAFVVSTSGLLQRLRDVTDGAAGLDLDALREVFLRIAFLVVATLAVYLALRLALGWLQRRIAAAAGRGDLTTRLKMMGSSVVLDVGTVVLAWAAGYVVGLRIGRVAEIGIEESLFLNAFLGVELIKAGARTVLAPRWPALRPLRVDDTTAAYWYFWLARFVGLVGYTFMFVAPILAAGVSAEVAEAVRIVVMFTALVIAITIILQNREAIRARLTGPVATGRTGAVARTLATVGRTWHIVGIGYLVIVFALWLADPDTALPFVLTATGQSVLAIAIGAVVAGFIGRMASGGMRLPADLKRRLPLLETRLNAFVPGMLKVVRGIVTIGVVVAVVQAWHIANVVGWLSGETGTRVLASVISALLILLIGGVLYLAVQSWIEYRLNPHNGRAVSARERTLLSLFRNAFTIVLGVITLMLVLSELGVNIGPLLAGAGVVGLAVGFGAQKLVQDIINGAFIQLENTMNEGDVVTVAGVTGAVERLTIRSVSLRCLDGSYHVIPFSAVDTMSNYMKHFSYHVAAIGVAYHSSIPEVKEAMREAFERLKQTELGAEIIGDFEMQGLVEFGDSAVVVRGRIKTLPGQQWALGRAYNELVKQVFDERGIEIPFPQLMLHIGGGKGTDASELTRTGVVIR